MRPSFVNSTKIFESLKQMGLIAQTNEQLNAFEVKFLREPLPRMEELKIEADELKPMVAPKNSTLGALGQKKLANAPVASTKYTGAMVMEEESEDVIE